MPNPVVHFEIRSSGSDELQRFYTDLFDWHVDASNPMNYGLVDTRTGKGINGGIAPRPGSPRASQAGPYSGLCTAPLPVVYSWRSCTDGHTHPSSPTPIGDLGENRNAPHRHPGEGRGPGAGHGYRLNARYRRTLPSQTPPPLRHSRENGNLGGSVATGVWPSAGDRTPTNIRAKPPFTNPNTRSNITLSRFDKRCPCQPTLSDVTGDNSAVIEVVLTLY